VSANERHLRFIRNELAAPRVAPGPRAYPKAVVDSPALVSLSVLAAQIVELGYGDVVFRVKRPYASPDAVEKRKQRSPRFWWSGRDKYPNARAPK
jgi:hypothetical protein